MRGDVFPKTSPFFKKCAENFRIYKKFTKREKRLNIPAVYYECQVRETPTP